MQKWFSLLIILSILGCKNNEHLSPSTEAIRVLKTDTPQSTTPSTGTAVPPTVTKILSTSLTITPTLPSTPELRQPFITPTLPPVTTLAGDSAELYQLRTWSDAQAAASVSSVETYAEEFMADINLHSFYGDRGRKEIVEAGNEFLLRFPHSPYRTEVEWQMVDASTYYPSNALDELLANLIAADLTTGIATLETFDNYLHAHGLQLNNSRCDECLPVPTSVTNLLGNRQKIWLAIIERLSGYLDGGVLMAIWQDEDGSFIVTPLISQWAAMTRFSGGITNFEVRQITDSAQPALLVETWGHSGSMLGSSLHIFRWDGEQFIQLPGTPFHFSGGVISDEWAFIEGDNPSRLQVVSHGLITTTYEWTGNIYETVEHTIAHVPPDQQTYFIAEWLQQQIHQENYTKVITFLEEALQKNTSNDDPFSISYQHVMHFILGMNYVYLEDKGMARSVFEALRDGASLAGFSLAAEAFLQEYDGLESAYKGCQAAYDVLLTNDLEVLRTAETIPLCSFDKLLMENLEQYDEGNIFDVARIIHPQQLDLNGDGWLDWVFMLSHPTLSDYAEIEVWSALQMDIETEFVKLTTFPTKKRGSGYDFD